MKKRALFLGILLTLALLLFMLGACGNFTVFPNYNTFLYEDADLSVSFSRDGERFETLSADTRLFTQRIYAALGEETLYLRLKNEGETTLRFSLDVRALGGVNVSKELFYRYAGEGETDAPHYAIGEEGRGTLLLAPWEQRTLSLSVGTEEKDAGVVAPQLGLTLYAEPMVYAFDTEDPLSYEMLTGKEVSVAFPKSTERIVFTDRPDPKGVALTDLSAKQNGAVVGWEEGGTYYVSTRVKGKRALANDNAAYLFADLKKLSHIDLSMLDTSKTRDFMRFFSGCSALSSVDLSLLDTKSAVRTRSMFNGCDALAVMQVDSWDVSALKDASYMFANTLALTSLDLSAWNLSGVAYTTAMFQSSGVKEIILPDSLTVMGSLFFNHTDRYIAPTLRLPASLSEVGLAHAFYNFGTKDFTAFETAEGSAVTAVDGVLYSADGKTLLALPKGKTFKDGIFEIKEGVTFLGELSFSRNPHVKTVLLPNSYRVSVYTEKHHADFADAGGTGNLNVGNSLNLAIYVYTGVEAYAVKADNPYYVTHDGALYTKGAGGKAEALVALPVGFQGELIIPEGVRAIENEALWADGEVLFEGLSRVHIPASLTEIAEGQLVKLNSLAATLSVEEENPVYTLDVNGKICLR